VFYPPGKAITYSYDAVGNRSVMVDSDWGRTTYSYDSRNVLNWLVNPRSERTTWVYNAIGRVTTMTHGNTSLAETDYDAAGRISALRNLKSDRSVLSIFTYTYDNAGNRTAVVEANGDRVTWSYDGIYQLTAEERSGDNGYAVVYTYDGDGKRRSFEDSVMLRNFLWDGENIARQTSSDGSTNRRYTYNPQAYGELISQDGPTFHHYDALGSTMLLTDGSQDTVISYLYRAFGEQTVLSGSNPNRFTWIGRLGYYRQPDTGDYWVRARVYRPQIGRWVSRDPMRHGLHWYRYATGNPATDIDPSGLRVCRRDKCGPEIKQPLMGTMANIAKAYANASSSRKLILCAAMVTPASIDIIDLFGGAPEVAAGCPTGKCAGTVQVGGNCFSAIAVNYVAAGLAYRICRWLNPPFNLIDMVSVYCLVRHHDIDLCGCAVAWFRIGYWWPRVPMAPGPCEPECGYCRQRVDVPAFTVLWNGIQINPDGSTVPRHWPWYY